MEYSFLFCCLTMPYTCYISTNLLLAHLKPVAQWDLQGRARNGIILGGVLLWKDILRQQTHLLTKNIYIFTFFKGTGINHHKVTTPYLSHCYALIVTLFINWDCFMQSWANVLFSLGLKIIQMSKNQWFPWKK